MSSAVKGFTIFKLLSILFLCVLFSKTFAQLPEFDGNSAFTFLYRQVEWGPRNPGSEGHSRAIEEYKEWFEECGAEVTLQRFKAKIHKSFEADSEMEEIDATNIIAHFGTSKRSTYMFCAHYDTRPWADFETDPQKQMTPIPGANDGASGVAVLLEMARLFAVNPPPVSVDLVLFDVEDAGIQGNNNTWCLGSAYFARHYAGSAPAGSILVDMIGDTDLEIPKEYFSYAYSKEWTDHLFQLAEEVGSYSFIDEIGDPVYDDHVNLIRGGFTVTNFIDFDYPYWHTLEDTPEKCSAQSLEQVGNVLVRLVYGD